MRLSRQHLLIAPLLIVTFEIITYLSMDMYLPALPFLSHAFNVPTTWIKATITLWFLGSASMQLFVGPLTDRLGSRTVLISGCIIFAVGSLFCYSALGIGWFLLGRLLQGIIVCFVVVAGYTFIHAALEHKQAVKTVAWMNAVTIAAPAGGPLIGGLIIHISAWQNIFLVLFVASLILLGGLISWLPKADHTATEGKPPGLGQILINYAQIIRTPNFLSPTLILCILFATMIIWITAAPFLIIDHFNYSPLIFGCLQATVFISLMLGARVMHTLYNYLGDYPIIVIGCLTSLVGSILVPLAALFNTGQLIIIISGMMLIAFGFGVANSNLQRLAVESVSHPMGQRMAVFFSAFSWAGVAGSQVTSMVYSGHILPLGIAMLILMIIASLGLVGKKWLINQHQQQDA